MKIKAVILFIAVLLVGKISQAQDTLPRFSVEDKGNGRIVVSWANPYPNLIQLAVQRSYDSIKRFSSVFSASSPELPVNGFSDKVTPGAIVYYRIFYVMQGGSYYFTKSLRPGRQLASSEKVYDSRRDLLSEDLQKELSGKDTAVADKPIFVKTKTETIAMMPSEFKAFRDSVLTKTNDTLLQQSEDTISLEPYSPAFVQRTSEFVFTDRDGFIVIKLPDAATKKYELVFFEEDDTPVLELRNLKESYLTLDKTNFYHGGWYKFEILENGRIKERNKIYLPKDF